jgi:hypothetical protein
MVMILWAQIQHIAGSSLKNSGPSCDCSSADNTVDVGSDLVSFAS